MKWANPDVVATGFFKRDVIRYDLDDRGSIAHLSNFVLLDHTPVLGESASGPAKGLARRVAEKCFPAELHNTLPQSRQGCCQIGGLHLVLRLHRNPGGRNQHEKHEGEDRRSFADSNDNPANTVEGLKKESFFQAVQHATEQATNKIDHEENRHEGDGFVKYGRRLPVEFQRSCQILIVANGHNKASDQAGQRKNFPKESFEVTP